jgi:arsenate reductase
MKKIFHLSSCNSCERVIDELKLKNKKFIFQDLKTEPITEQQLEELKDKAGSYEALFSKIARKYRALGLHEKVLSENDYKNFILKEYTFLKRPVILIKDSIFIRSSKNTLIEAKKELI